LGIKLCMFRTFPLSTIRSFSLYTKQYIQVCWQAVTKSVWHIPPLCVQWKPPDDGQRNCPKHVEFYSKNKSEKLVDPVSFIITICHDARSAERQKQSNFVFIFIILPRKKHSYYFSSCENCCINKQLFPFCNFMHTYLVWAVPARLRSRPSPCGSKPARIFCRVTTFPRLSSGDWLPWEGERVGGGGGFWESCCGANEARTLTHSSLCCNLIWQARPVDACCCAS